MIILLMLIINSLSLKKGDSTMYKYSINPRDSFKSIISCDEYISIKIINTVDGITICDYHGNGLEYFYKNSGGYLITLKTYLHNVSNYTTLCKVSVSYIKDNTLNIIYAITCVIITFVVLMLIIMITCFMILTCCVYGKRSWIIINRPS